MKCKNCGAEKTIKAHLIPRVFCVQVQTGKSHAALVNQNGKFKTTQSGLWDPNILCCACDGKLGEFENYTHKVATSIRESGLKRTGKFKISQGVDTNKILRFCAGILYKYSLTTKENGRIDLNSYQDVLRTFLFNTQSSVPDDLDAFILRPLRYPLDDGMFAYRTPKPDIKYGINFYRMMMGGLIFFVKLDSRKFQDEHISKILIKDLKGLPFLTSPVIGLEEYEIPMKSFKNNNNLSNYLDRNP